MGKRIALIVLISAAICGGYYYYLTTTDKQVASSEDTLSPAAGAEKKDEAKKSETEASPAVADIGSGDFILTDQNGKPFNTKDLKGKKTLVFFGFTNCPDVCPVSMAVITEVMNQLETAEKTNVAPKVTPVFITVDPDRDTPEVMKTYLKDYYQGFVALTGTKEELEKIQKSYKVYAQKAEEEKSHSGHEGHGDHAGHDYNVSHSDLIYYMDENGKFIHHFNRDTPPEDIVEYITSN